MSLHKEVCPIPVPPRPPEPSTGQDTPWPRLHSPVTLGLMWGKTQGCEGGGVIL